jgi:hypothetical protein
MLRDNSSDAASADEGEGISGLEDRAIPDSPWVIRNRVMGQPSPVNGAGWLDVFAENTSTGAKVLLMRLGDIQTPIEERFETPDHLIMTMPNRVDIIERHDAFANIAVLYRFTPKDDPRERAAYQFWFHHPHDAKAEDWFMKNMVNKAFCQ